MQTAEHTKPIERNDEVRVRVPGWRGREGTVQWGPLDHEGRDYYMVFVYGLGKQLVAVDYLEHKDDTA